MANKKAEPSKAEAKPTYEELRVANEQLAVLVRGYVKKCNTLEQELMLFSENKQNK